MSTGRGYGYAPSCFWGWNTASAITRPQVFSMSEIQSKQRLVVPHIHPVVASEPRVSCLEARGFLLVRRYFRGVSYHHLEPAVPPLTSLPAGSFSPSASSQALIQKPVLLRNAHFVGSTWLDTHAEMKGTHNGK